MRPPGGPEPSAGWILLLVGLALVPYFLCLGTPPLWDANESLYAQPPREALDWPQGDALAPTWNGKPYFAHGPLSTWITLPFYAWLGPSPLGHRLPMALAAVLIVVATWRLGCLLGGRRLGLLAALALAATPRVWLFCRQLSGDVYLTAALTGALALALPAVAGRTRGRGGLRLANVLVGLGFTAKGPVILVLYGGTLLLVWWLGRPRASWAWLRPWRGLALIVAVGSPWFLYMTWRYGGTFLAQHFGHYTFRRMAGDIGVRSWFFYLQALAGDGQPWITVLPFAGLIAWRARDRRPAALLPWLGMLWCVAFFTLSEGKRNVYLLPAYPLMAVAVAPLAEAVWRGAHRPGVRLAAVGAGVGCAAGALALFLLARNEPRLSPEIYAPMGVLALAGGPLLVGGWLGRGRWLCAGSLATVVLLEAAAALAMPALARFHPVPELAARVRAEQSRGAPEPVVNYRVATHSMNFYLDRPTKVADSAEDLLAKMAPSRTAFVVVPARRFDRPGTKPGDPRVGLRHELPEASFEELERRPLLIFQFRRSILGRGRTTKDLLLVRVHLDDDPLAILARMRAGTEHR
jgi:4-amino-4-deoxy-L-arabinose transferase-like glycosyltransferase